MSRKTGMALPNPERYRLILVCLLLVLSTGVSYFPAHTFEFVHYDDGQYVFENRYVMDGLTLKGVSWAFTTIHAANWHPITWLSHMLDTQLFGLNPGRHHLTNLLFHAANVLLLYFLLLRMTASLWRSAFVAALFALHPLHVESVVWISERKDLLSTFFWTLSVWSYVRWVERPGAARYLAVMVFFSLGLMAKPMVVTMPFVLLLLDYWPLNRTGSTCHDAARSHGLRNFFKMTREKVPLFALATMSGAMTMYAQKHGAALVSFDILPFSVRLANALVSYTSYIVKMHLPFHLAIYYPHQESLPWWKPAGASILLIAVTWIAFRRRREAPYLLVGWLWYVGTLFPVIGLVQAGLQAMADRYTYLPLVGISIIIVWGVADLLGNKRRKIAWGTLISVILFPLLIAATHRQVALWRDSITLLTHALESTPDNYHVHNNLGVALVEKGRFDEAIVHYREAIRIRPKYEDPYHNLGYALYRKGRIDSAVTYYRKALRINPDYGEAHISLGNALLHNGRIDSAVTHYRSALAVNNDLEEAHYNLGNALARKGMIDDAIESYREALRLDPGLAIAHNNLGNALLKKGLTDDAIRHYSEALRHDPEFGLARHNLEKALRSRGLDDDGIRRYLEALRANLEGDISGDHLPDRPP